jgi:hypothetical protein
LLAGIRSTQIPEPIAAKCKLKLCKVAARSSQNRVQISKGHSHLGMLPPRPAYHASERRGFAAAPGREVAMDRFVGEPSLDEILSDPLVRSVMKADGIEMRRLCEVLVKAASALAVPPRPAVSRERVA